MDLFSFKFFIWAVLLGAISAASLPLGSMVGLRIKPRPAIISLLAAFGSGALIAALSVELVAPTVMAISSTENIDGHGNPVLDFYGLITGAILGGILFVLLDQLVNAGGGFLRKKASSIAYFSMAEKKRKKKLVEQLSTFPLLQNLPSEHIETLISLLQPKVYAKNETIAKQGVAVNNLFFIFKGIVQIIRDGQKMKEMKPGDVLGMIPLISSIPSPGTAEAESIVSGMVLSVEGFSMLREISAEFDEACRNLATQNLDYLEDHIAKQTKSAIDWKKQAVEALEEGISMPNSLRMRLAKEEHKNAGMAIWLGILLDGIPESLVIGGGLLISLKIQVSMGNELFLRNVIPYTLIAGLFLSNFPEALSSSANMKLQGWSNQKIFLMWFSLMVITGIGAGCGFILTESLSHTALIFLEGLASGAMLTMIAAAMIPEAVHLGKANAVGISTLIGFIAAISFKLFE